MNGFFLLQRAVLGWEGRDLTREDIQLLHRMGIAWSNEHEFLKGN